jgi:hypothetical protein
VIQTNEPTAQVLLDGALAGEARDLKSIWLEPGAYNLTVRAQARTPFEMRVYVLSGKTLKISRPEPSAGVAPMIRYLRLLILTTAAVALAAAPGTVPRPKAADYAIHGEIDGTQIGLAVISAAEAKKLIVSDPSAEFLVIEVALYPQPGHDLAVSRNNFRFYVRGRDRALYPENPKVVASLLQEKNSRAKDVVLVPQVGVGYESGGTGYDPTYGRYPRRGGWYTSTGVGVGVDNAGPVSPKDRDTMELELTEKGLPDGTATRPIAGFLYFRLDNKTIKNANVHYRLEFDLAGKTATFALP